jgi:hypothetical protein
VKDNRIKHFLQNDGPVFQSEFQSGEALLFSTSFPTFQLSHCEMMRRFMSILFNFWLYSFAMLHVALSQMVKFPRVWIIGTT